MWNSTHIHYSSWTKLQNNLHSHDWRNDTEWNTAVCRHGTEWNSPNAIVATQPPKTRLSLCFPRARSLSLSCSLVNIPFNCCRPHPAQGIVISGSIWLSSCSTTNTTTRHRARLSPRIESVVASSKHREHSQSLSVPPPTDHRRRRPTTQRGYHSLRHNNKSHGPEWGFHDYNMYISLAAVFIRGGCRRAPLLLMNGKCAGKWEAAAAAARMKTLLLFTYSLRSHYQPLLNPSM